MLVPAAAALSEMQLTIDGSMVGSIDGSPMAVEEDGLAVALIGLRVGRFTGNLLGVTEGLLDTGSGDGWLDRRGVTGRVAAVVGPAVGSKVLEVGGLDSGDDEISFGIDEGAIDEVNNGAIDGPSDGGPDGDTDGTVDGAVDGATDESSDGFADEAVDGCVDGAIVDS